MHVLSQSAVAWPLNAGPRRGGRPAPASARGRVRPVAASAETGPAAVRAQDLKATKPGGFGAATVLGTSRKSNEDRSSTCVDPALLPAGASGYWAVFDGHGGSAVAEWLKRQLLSHVTSAWAEPAPGGMQRGADPAAAFTAAFAAADDTLLRPPSLFFSERGVGGAKCGACAAVALLLTPAGAPPRLVAANVGDSRVLLVRDGGNVEMLSVDHVPDEETERKRIEAYNPNPKLPLVRFVGGTWRVGGLLALSRAFGDAYLKPTGLYEGLDVRDSDYSSGFGLTPIPWVRDVMLSPGDEWAVIASDGVFAEVDRGGGGGFENQACGDFVRSCAAKGMAPEAIAAAVVAEAATIGSTDDITCIVVKLA